MWQQIVEEVDRLPHSEQGVYIPYVWFQHFISEAGLVQFNPMAMLADILFWYRPKRLIDEQTGKLIKTDKFFEKDKLHRNYRYWMQRLKLSKKQARLGLSILIDKGLVTVEYRNEMIKGKWHKDRMYVEPVMSGIAALFEEIPEPELPPEIDEHDPLGNLATAALFVGPGGSSTSVQVPSETPGNTGNATCPQGHRGVPSRADVDESIMTKDHISPDSHHVDYLGMFDEADKITLKSCHIFLDEIVYPFDSEGNLVTEDGFRSDDPLFLLLKRFTKDKGKSNLQGRDRTNFMALKSACLKDIQFLQWTLSRAKANRDKWYLSGLIRAVFDPAKYEQFKRGVFIENEGDIEAAIATMIGSGQVTKGADRFKKRSFDLDQMYADEFPPDLMEQTKREE